MTEREQAERLYKMVRAQIVEGHDPKKLHTATKAVCGEFLNILTREDDSGYWFGVKTKLADIEEQSESKK